MYQEKWELLSDFFGRDLMNMSGVRAFMDAHFHACEYATRELVTRAGEIEKYSYVVQSGVQMLYHLGGEGEKRVVGFSYAGCPSGVFDSFVTQSPSHFFLETLTPSAMFRISHAKYLALFEKYAALYKWRADFSERILFGRIDREIEMQNLSARERFEAFMVRCPSILHTIPQKYLASYLQMTPETYSRLRAMYKS